MNVGHDKKDDGMQSMCICILLRVKIIIKKTKARNENNSKACLGKSGNQNGKMEKWRNKQMMRHGIELGEYAMNEFEKLFWFYFSSCQQQHLKTNYPIKAEITSQKAPGK